MPGNAHPCAGNSVPSHPVNTPPDISDFPSPPQEPAPLLPRLLEGVVTLRKIASGAYGTVFLGRDAAHREVAVKALHPQVPQEGQERERQGLIAYLEEFRNGGDHLLTVYQISPAGEWLRYSMELADNLNDPFSSDEYAAWTLGTWLERHGPPSVERIADWMHQLLDGVEALLEELDRYTRPAPALHAFGARVFKVSQDEQGTRLTWLRVTGGELKVRSPIR